MSFDYVSVEDAVQRPGLRMVVVGGVPSPWGEAAKGIPHVKGLAWAAVRLDHASDALKQWTGGRCDGPVLIHNDEPPRHAWDQILLLAERQAPEPAILPHDAADRACAMGLAHEICGEGGLGWTRRRANRLLYAVDHDYPDAAMRILNWLIKQRERLERNGQ